MLCYTMYSKVASMPTCPVDLCTGEGTAVQKCQQKSSTHIFQPDIKVSLNLNPPAGLTTNSYKLVVWVTKIKQ